MACGMWEMVCVSPLALPRRVSKLKPNAASWSRPSGVIMSMVHRGCQVQSMRNSSTSPASVAAHSSSIRSVSGQAGVVSVIVMMARPNASISMPYTRPRSITSMPSSGSMTWCSASRTSAAVARPISST